MTFALIHILRMVIIMVRLQVALLKAATPDTTDLSFIEIDRTIDDTELFFQQYVADQGNTQFVVNNKSKLVN
jgi:hypothetical protein